MKLQHIVKSQYNCCCTVFMVFILTACRLLSLCRHIRGELVREVLCPRDWAADREERGKTWVSSGRVALYIKLRGNGNVRQDARKSHRFWNKGILVNFCRMCFLQCSHKHSGDHLRNRTIMNAFKNCPKNVCWWTFLVGASLAVLLCAAWATN